MCSIGYQGVVSDGQHDIPAKEYSHQECAGQAGKEKSTLAYAYDDARGPHVARVSVSWRTTPRSLKMSWQLAEDSISATPYDAERITIHQAFETGVRIPAHPRPLLHHAQADSIMDRSLDETIAERQVRHCQFQFLDVTDILVALIATLKRPSCRSSSSAPQRLSTRWRQKGSVIRIVALESSS